MTSDRSLADLDPTMRAKCEQFIALCTEAGIKVIITETFRSEADQNADYTKGRTAPGPKITNAKFGQSAHNCVGPQGQPAAKAFDFAIEKADGSLDWNASDESWERAIAIGESLGLVSGSTWHSLKDDPHFELPNWQEKSTANTQEV